MRCARHSGSVGLKEAVFDKLHCGVCFRFGLKRSAVNEIEATRLPELFRELSELPYSSRIPTRVVKLSPCKSVCPMTTRSTIWAPSSTSAA